MLNAFRQHVWVSISTDLHLDAQRDFQDLGCHINIINNCQTLDKETKALGLSKDFQVGCLGGGGRARTGCFGAFVGYYGRQWQLHMGL